MLYTYIKLAIIKWPEKDIKDHLNVAQLIATSSYTLISDPEINSNI